MEEVSGSREMAKIIYGAHKVNLGSSDREKPRERGAQGQILKGAGSGGPPLAEPH